MLVTTLNISFGVLLIVVFLMLFRELHTASKHSKRKHDDLIKDMLFTCQFSKNSESINREIAKINRKLLDLQSKIDKPAISSYRQNDPQAPG